LINNKHGANLLSLIGIWRWKQWRLRLKSAICLLKFAFVIIIFKFIIILYYLMNYISILERK